MGSCRRCCHWHSAAWGAGLPAKRAFHVGPGCAAQQVGGPDLSGGLTGAGVILVRPAGLGFQWGTAAACCSGRVADSCRAERRASAGLAAPWHSAGGCGKHAAGVLAGGWTWAGRRLLRALKCCAAVQLRSPLCCAPLLAGLIWQPVVAQPPIPTGWGGPSKEQASPWALPDPGRGLASAPALVGAPRLRPARLGPPSPGAACRRRGRLRRRGSCVGAALPADGAHVSSAVLYVEWGAAAEGGDLEWRHRGGAGRRLVLVCMCVHNP